MRVSVCDEALRVLVLATLAISALLGGALRVTLCDR